MVSQVGDVGRVLFCNPLQRRVIVEAEIASVYDVVCTSLLGEVIQRSKVT